jgi:hypothetical protein
MAQAVEVYLSRFESQALAGFHAKRLEEPPSQRRLPRPTWRHPLTAGS